MSMLILITTTGHACFLCMLLTLDNDLSKITFIQNPILVNARDWLSVTLPLMNPVHPEKFILILDYSSLYCNSADLLIYMLS